MGDPARLRCYSPNGSGGHDIAGKIEKVLSLQRRCREMQEIAATLSGGGEEKLPSGETITTTFSNKTEDGNNVNCEMDQNGDHCESLNCYTSDTGVMDGIKTLRKRNLECKAFYDKNQALAKQDEERLEEGVKSGNLDTDTIKHL